jgi:hypothetical protein
MKWWPVLWHQPQCHCETLCKLAPGAYRGSWTRGRSLWWPWTPPSLDAGFPWSCTWGQPWCPSVLVEPEACGGDRSFSHKGLHLISILVDLSGLCVAQGRVLLISFVLYVVIMVLLLLLLLDRWALSYCAFRYHQLDQKRLLLLWCMLRLIGLWLLRLWHVPTCQLTNRRITGALACGVVSVSHLSFRKRRVWDNKILKNLRK